MAMAELARRGCSALWACDWVASASRSSRLAPSVVMHLFRGADSMERSLAAALQSMAVQLKAVAPGFVLPDVGELRNVTSQDLLLKYMIEPAASPGGRAAGRPRRVCWNRLPSYRASRRLGLRASLVALARHLFSTRGRHCQGHCRIQARDARAHGRGQ